MNTAVLITSSSMSVLLDADLDLLRPVGTGDDLGNASMNSLRSFSVSKYSGNLIYNNMIIY